MPDVLHVKADHALNRVSEPLRLRIVAAQGDTIETDFPTAFDFCARIFADLKISIAPPDDLKSAPPTVLGDKPTHELVEFYSAIQKKSGVPAQAIPLQAKNLAHRTQLQRAFKDPESVIAATSDKVASVVRDFPKEADDIRCGKNPGDVLDPYIMAAAQTLLCADNFEQTVSATVSHKVMMIIEGLLGHLHEDVIGEMRGNVRVPEPRGDDQETLNPEKNPFPGADVMQPPLANGRPLRFHQVKSKTGSAKGGDGKRLGIQLNELVKMYGGEAYYNALIGATLRGHRSMAGVLRVAPDVVVLVGESAFEMLTGSVVGPQLLLRLYQSSFESAAIKEGYTFKTVVASIHAAMLARATELGEDFMEAILRDATAGDKSKQDSRHFTAQRRRKN